MLRLWGIEATQAIQYFKSTHPLCPGPGGTKVPCPDNSVPLVAGKQLVLRLYVSGGTPGSWLAAVVTHPRAGGEWYGPNYHAAGFGGMPASATPATRTNAGSTIQVVLGPYQAGTYTFNVVILEYDPAWALIGIAVSTITLKFDERRRIRVRLVRIRYTGRGMNVAPPSVKDFWDATDFAQRTLPLPAPGFEIVRESVEPYDGDFTRIDPSAHDQMWSGYAANRGTTGNLLNILDRLVAAESLPGDVMYVAIYPANTNQSAFAGWAVGRWIISDRNGETLAHEILHMSGVPQHAPCGNPANVDPNYPDYPSFSPLPAASIGEVGFDLSGAGMRALNPATTFDLMSYCGPRWISPYHYVRCFNSVPPLPPAPPSSGGPTLPDQYVHFGFVRFPDRWVVVDFPRFARPLPMPPRPPAGEIQVIVRDGSGRTLGRAPTRFVPAEYPGPEHGGFYDAEAPYHPDAERIELVRGNEVLARVTAEPAPKLDVTFPSGKGELEHRRGQLRYRADGKAERIAVAVRASSDGGATWTGEVHSGRAGTVDLESLLAPLTGDECWLEVLASSGYHTTAVGSPPFRLRPRERDMLAWSSAAGRATRRGDVVELIAIADNGSAEPFELRWVSDLCGEIGVGARLLTTALTPGHHRIEVRSSRPFVRPAYIELDVE